MNQFKTIFIKYFLIIFTAFFVLVAFLTFNDQGKVDLQFSLLFSILIAILGAALASIFIGGFRKLDAEPPKIQPSEYLLVDPIALNKQLKKIRHTRILEFTLFFLCIPFIIFVRVFQLPMFLIYIYVVALAIISWINVLAKCPRCGYYYHFRTIKILGGDLGNETLNLLFGPGYRNYITKKCLNCGLDIKGKSNI
jgi:predicted nucleic-acid-binding Zn-ribbon protein